MGKAQNKRGVKTSFEKVNQATHIHSKHSIGKNRGDPVTAVKGFNGTTNSQKIDVLEVVRISSEMRTTAVPEKSSGLNNKKSRKGVRLEMIVIE